MARPPLPVLAAVLFLCALPGLSRAVQEDEGTHREPPLPQRPEPVARAEVRGQYSVRSGLSDSESSILLTVTPEAGNITTSGV